MTQKQRKNKPYQVDLARVEAGMREIILGLGLDPDNPPLKGTPSRVAGMYQEVFSGIGADPGEELTVFTDIRYDEMVLVKDIPLYSMCEHHFLPFIGSAHVAYVPSEGRVTGLSKLARVVSILAARPQVQERLTTQIAEVIMQKLKPLGVLVVCEAEHLCMSMRGIKKPGTTTVTSSVLGLFRKNPAAREEAMSLIFGGRVK
jgi:GTP cyclohydrolase IA